MKSDMNGVPEGWVGLEVDGVYVNLSTNQLIVTGEPIEESEHNCDVMGCSTFYHTLVRCEIPEWQAAQLRVQLTDGGYLASDSLSTPTTISN